MVPFKVLECKDYAAIKEELLSYINEFTDLLTKNPFAEDYDQNNPVKYPNFVDTIHFVKHNPKTIAWFKSLKLVMRDVYFTLTWYTDEDSFTVSPCKLHIDKPPVKWKMNFPVLNMEPTSVRFFKSKDIDLDIQSIVRRNGNPESKDNDNYGLPYSQFELDTLHRFDKNEPIIMNGQIPHDVGVHDAVKYPRIGIQFMFFPEPTHLVDIN
jgi:hypothetical protein